MPTLDLKPKYTKSVSEPWFSLISLGIKSVEGRLDKGDFQNMAIGDLVKWINDDFQPRSVLTKIVRKTKYSSFNEYLKAEGLDKCLPTFKSLDDGVKVYHKYYSYQDEQQYGVIAICLEVV